MKRWIAALLVLCMLATMMVGAPATALAADNTPPLAPTGLMMELSNEPLGIEAESPSLAWEVNDADQDEVQTAYRILVATSEEKLVEGEADVWDSGKVDSSQNTGVLYAGPSLAADSVYYWTVKTWDKKGAEGPYADPQFFTTAVKDNWDASAIWYDAKKPDDEELLRQAGLTDYTMECDFSITDIALGFSVRKPTNNTTEDKFYMMQVRAETEDTPAILRPHLGFSVQEDVDLSKFGISIQTGETHHIKISAIGSEIKVWIDEILVAEFVWTQQSFGTFGVRCGASESGYLDHLKVAKPDGSVIYESDFSNGQSPFANGGTIEDGRLKVGKGEKLFYVVGEHQLTDYTMEADFSISSVAMGFVVRKPKPAPSEENFYLLQVRAETEDTPAILRPHINTGAQTDVDLSEFGISLKTGETHHIKISAIGSEIKVWIDEILVATLAWTQHSEGTFGIRCGMSESGYIDNLKVTYADGSSCVDTDFSDGRNPFSYGGTVSDGRLNVGKGEKIYYTESDMVELKDYTMDCDFEIENVALAFCVRKTEYNTVENKLYMFQVRAETDTTPAVLKSHLNMAVMEEVDLSQFGLSVKPGEPHHMNISAIGDHIVVSIDGVEVAAYDWDNNPEGTFGVRCGRSESGYIDNLKVTTSDGLVYLQNDFSKNNNPFEGGGSVVDGRFYIAKDQKLYHVPKDNVIKPKGEAVFLRREFSVTKPVKKAIVSAIGKSNQETLQYVYKMYLNGEFAGLGSPRSISDTPYQNVYNTFDVTDLIRQGDNCIGVIAYALSDQRLQARLKIFYEDGTSEVISTDESWKALDGTAAFGDNGQSVGTSLYTLMAENIDARVYPFGFSEAGFDDAGWEPVKVKDTITNLAASPVENTKEFVMPVEKIVDKGNGNYFIQLEKEIVGGIRLKIPNGTEGTKLTLLYGEELSGENTVKWQMRCGNNYREYWTLKDGAQVLEHWGMRNFRYIEIQNCPFELTADMIEGVALRQDFDDTDASLQSSSELLDDIFEFMKYSMKATNQDMYTDSQARERGAFATGDFYINQLTSYAVSRNYNLAKYSILHTTINASGWTEFDKVGIMNAWDQYLYTGDKTILEGYYDKLVRFLHLDAELDDTGLYWHKTGNGDLIDWPAAERDNYDISNSDYNTVINAYQYEALLTMADIADLLEKNADAEKYRSMASGIKEAVNSTLYDVNGNGLYIEGMQKDGTLNTGNAVHASLYPLLYGMVDGEEEQDLIAQYLADGGMKGSVYFSQFFLEALYKYGQADAAMGYLTSTDTKSWAHMMNDLDATISCEAWDPSIKSNMTFSHPWGAAAGNIIVRETFGIKPLEAAFDKIQIKPQLGTLDYATIQTPTIKGSVKVSACQNSTDSLYEMTATIPANTTAKVYVPVSGSTGNTVLVDGEPVQAQIEDGFFVLDNMGSGTHTYQVPTTNVTAEAVDAQTGKPIAEVTANESFIVRVTAPANVTDIVLFNEDGLRMGKESVEKQQNADGTVIWEIGTAIGTVGDGRKLSVYTALDGGVLTDTGVSIGLDVKAPVPVISSVSIEDQAVVNKPVTITAVTGQDVAKLEVYNTNGLKMSVLSSDYLDTGEGRVWTLSIKIGTAGVRPFEVIAKNRYGVESKPLTTGEVTVRYF